MKPGLKNTDIDNYFLLNDIEPVYNDRPWGQKCLAVVNRWSLMTGYFKFLNNNWDSKSEIAVGGSWIGSLQYIQPRL